MLASKCSPRLIFYVWLWSLQGSGTAAERADGLAASGPAEITALSSTGRRAAPRHFLKICVLWNFPIETTVHLSYHLGSRGLFPSHLSKQCLVWRSLIN